ncbi:bestrophin-2-like [Homarus americanus]|nr:bestrophin-2-like [Homarus americanus]
MTVEYTKEVGNTRCCIFARLLFRWRGSVYKLLWRDVLVYIVLYTIISCFYRFYLKDPHKKIFEELVMHSVRYRNLVPVCFLLGFYVSLVVSRWWGTCLALPDNTNTAVLLATHIPGNDRRAFEIRTRIVRYINLTYCMVFSQVSAPVRVKYPDVQSLVNENLATELEGRVLEDAERHGCRDNKWLPITWCCQLVQCAREEGFLITETAKETVVTELLNLRRQCGALLDWHQYNIPLVYTQVVTYGVYTYFLFSLISEQFLDEARHYRNYEVDLVVPVFALLELVFYLGWLKVAESLLNPFGIDDHSFEFLNILEDSRYSAFVISHTRYGQYSPEAQWRPPDEDRLEIVNLGVLPGMIGDIITPDTVLGSSI